jgi:glycosyltransferase involved in cell wall biosynthesis
MSPATARTDPFFERLIFRHADIVIANTSSVAEMWKERHPRWKHKIRLVWNGFDPENAPKALPVSAADIRTLAHVGTIYGDRDPLPVLSAIDLLIQSGAVDWRRLKVGLYGPLHLKDEAASARLESFARREWLEIRNMQIDKEEAAKLTASTDYLLLLDVLGSKAGLQVPAKLFEYISIGRPILASTTGGSPVADILAKSSVPHLCYDGKWTDTERQRMIEFFSLPSEPVEPSDWFQTTFNAMAQASAISHFAVQIAHTTPRH